MRALDKWLYDSKQPSPPLQLVDAVRVFFFKAKLKRLDIDKSVLSENSVSLYHWSVSHKEDMLNMMRLIDAGAFITKFSLDGLNLIHPSLGLHCLLDDAYGQFEFHFRLATKAELTPFMHDNGVEPLVEGDIMVLRKGVKLIPGNHTLVCVEKVGSRITINTGANSVTVPRHALYDIPEGVVGVGVASQLKYIINDDGFIIALRDMPNINVSIGQRGAKVQTHRNLSHDGCCWADASCVLEEGSFVEDDAQIIYDSVLKNTWVTGNSTVDRSMLVDTQVAGSYLVSCTTKGTQIDSSKLFCAEVTGRSIRDSTITASTITDVSIVTSLINRSTLGGTGATTSIADSNLLHVEGFGLQFVSIKNSHITHKSHQELPASSAIYLSADGVDIIDADIYHNAELIIISHVGRDDSTLAAYPKRDGFDAYRVMVSRGCFNDTLTEFKAQVEKTHNLGNDRILKDYRALSVYIAQHFKNLPKWKSTRAVPKKKSK